MVVFVISCVSNFKRQCLHCGMPISVTTVSQLQSNLAWPCKHHVHTQCGLMLFGEGEGLSTHYHHYYITRSMPLSLSLSLSLSIPPRSPRCPYPWGHLHVLRLPHDPANLLHWGHSPYPIPCGGIHCPQTLHEEFQWPLHPGGSAQCAYHWTSGQHTVFFHSVCCQLSRQGETELSLQQHH